MWVVVDATNMSKLARVATLNDDELLEAAATVMEELDGAACCSLRPPPSWTGRTDGFCTNPTRVHEPHFRPSRRLSPSLTLCHSRPV